MSMKIIAPIAALIVAANVWAIAPAIDKEFKTSDALTINHQFDNLDNQADLDEEVIYQASSQAQTAKHANNFIKTNRN